MDFSNKKAIEIVDKTLFDEYFRNFPPEISEFTFTNLFIWRNYYNFNFLEWEDHLLIFSEDIFKKYKESHSKNPDTLFFMPPIGADPVKIIIELFRDLKYIEIHRVPESLLNELKINAEYNSSDIQSVEDRDNWDYVYEREKLITLAGRKLYRKRRWLRRFKENHPNHEFHLFSADWITPCKELQIQWCDMNECRLHEDLKEEMEAIANAFNFYPNLNFRGGLLLVDGKCVAYTFGERLNPNTVVIHIEKALINYEGSYQAINNFFAQHCCEDVSYINREQDLGNPGLRAAKMSYYPHSMVKKHILYRYNK